MSTSKQELFDSVATILRDTFDIPAEKIRPEAQLATDLDIDSIDAVDLMVEARKLVGRRLQPEDFKAVRTVQDVVDALYLIAQE